MDSINREIAQGVESGLRGVKKAVMENIAVLVVIDKKSTRLIGYDYFVWKKAYENTQLIFLARVKVLSMTVGPNVMYV